MLRIILTIGSVQILAILVNIVKSKILAVLLGPQGVGIVSVIDQVVQLAAYLSVLSLPFASVKFLSRAHSEGAESFRRTYATFLMAILALAVTGTVVAMGIATLRADLLGANIGRYRGFWLIALASIPAMVLVGFSSHVLAAAQRFKAASVLAVITALVMTVAAYSGISAAGIFGLYVANFAAGVVLTLGVLLYLRRRLALPFYERKARFFQELFRSPEVIRFSLILFLAAFTNSLCFLVARYSILNRFGETEAGLLQAAIAVGMSINLVLNPANGLFLTPMMNRRMDNEKKLTAAVEFQKKLLIVLGFVGMPMVLFPDWILVLLFSREFVAVSGHVYLFVLAQCVMQLAGVYQAAMIGLDDLRGYASIACLGHLAFGLSSWLLAPLYGIAGVGVALIISSICLYVGSWARLKLTHGFLFSEGVGLLLAYELLSLVLAGLFLESAGNPEFSLILSKIGIFLVFAASLWFFLTKEERLSLCVASWTRIN